jgi:hypothetical protein
MAKPYAALVSAFQGQNDQDQPFRIGMPLYTADALTNTFTA